MEVLQSSYSSVYKVVANKLTAYERSDSVGLLKPVRKKIDFEAARRLK